MLVTLRSSFGSFSDETHNLYKVRSVKGWSLPFEDLESRR